MARCARCSKFMLFSQPSGYCKGCEIAVKEERRRKEEEERQRKAEEERRRKEEEERQRKVEEERRRKEEEERQRKAEEERRRKEEEERRRKAAEEEKRKAEESKKKMSLKDAQRDYDEGCKYFGSSDPTIKAKAAPLFLRAAEAGLAISQTQIGNMLVTGDGVKQDIKKGIEWTEKAVAQKYPMAEANLAGYYYQGIGVPQDKKKALELFRRAADQNDDLALYLLGKFYAEGDGVPQDLETARKYYLAAVANGNTDALIAIIGDEERMNYCGRKQCLPIVKEEFNAVLSLMKKRVRVQDIGIKQEFFNTVMASKRAENYVKANRQYMIIVLQAGCLSSNVASGWLKVLAATGAVNDAIAIGEFALGYPNVDRIIDQAWGMLENNTRLLKTYVANKSWQQLADRCTELAGGYSSAVKIEELDVWL